MNGRMGGVEVRGEEEEEKEEEKLVRRSVGS